MSEDLIRRSDAIKAYNEAMGELVKWQMEEWQLGDFSECEFNTTDCKHIVRKIEAIPSADRPKGWIPCSERLPEDIRPVIVTWKNNDPESYYQYIVGKHFIGTAHYHRGKWYWYSSVTEDLLAEYGKCEAEEFDEAIEVVAWMPLPKPYGERKESDDA